jgi:cold shock CspA family protein
MDGRITYWNQKRGFGFVKRDTGGVAFVHIRCVVDDSVDALPRGDSSVAPSVAASNVVAMTTAIG